MPRLLTAKMISQSWSMQKLTRRNAISNKVFHDEYFYNIVWRDFACYLIFYWPAAEPLADARGTPVEKHW